MKRKIILGLICLFGGIFLSTDTFAQTVYNVTGPDIQVNPKFFIAILAGVLLALGFQLVLTNLSVAAGVTAVGDLREKSKKSNNEDKPEKNKKESKIKNTPAGVLFMSGIGIWNMITAGISLFFACFLGVKLSLIADNGMGIAMGLVIWAVFFMTMIYMESRAFGAIINGVFSAAIGAVKAGFTGIGSLFARSPETKIEHVVENSVERIKDDLQHAVEDSDLKARFETFLQKMEPKPFDTVKLKDELANLISDIRIETREGDTPGEKEMFLKMASKQPDLNKHDVDRLGKLFDIAKSVLAVAGVAGVAGGIAGTAAGIAGKTQIQQMKQEVEDYLRNNAEPDLRPQIVRAELEEIFNNPEYAHEIVKNHHNNMDKASVASVVALKEGISREEALQVANRVEEAINAILVKANIAEMSKGPGIAEKITGNITDKVNSVKDNILGGIEGRIQHFFDNMHRPELDYDLLKKEFEFMLHHPNLAPEVLRRKIKQFDSQTLTGIITSTGKFSEADITNMVHKFEEARSNVLQKLHDTESGFRSRIQQMKTFAVDEAEATRKTAVAASWWLFGAMIISGAAAAFGAMAAL